MGALVFRAIFIGAGAWLMQFHWIIYIFGGFLILTGLKMMFAQEKAIDPEMNPLIRLFERFMPVTHSFHGKHFFVHKNGRWAATPLFIALLFFEMTEIIFAVDSVPAIFAITAEPLIVFTSNIFAILGLRAMYSMLAGAVGKFHLLKYGLSIVLIFVGMPLAANSPLHGHLGTIAASIVASLILPPKEEHLNVK